MQQLRNTVVISADTTDTLKRRPDNFGCLMIQDVLYDKVELTEVVHEQKSD